MKKLECVLRGRKPRKRLELAAREEVQVETVGVKRRREIAPGAGLLRDHVAAATRAHLGCEPPTERSLELYAHSYRTLEDPPPKPQKTQEKKVSNKKITKNIWKTTSSRCRPDACFRPK